MSFIYKNFQKYCTDVENAQDEEEGDNSARGGKEKEKRPDYEAFKKLKDVNGKTGDQIVCSLLSACFVEDLKPVELHLAKYLECCF